MQGSWLCRLRIGRSKRIRRVRHSNERKKLSCRAVTESPILGPLAGNYRPYGNNPALHFKSIELLGQVTKAEVSGGMFSANRQINRSIGFLPYFVDPAFQFVTTVSGGVDA